MFLWFPPFPRFVLPFLSDVGSVLRYGPVGRNYNISRSGWADVSDVHLYFQFPSVRQLLQTFLQRLGGYSVEAVPVVVGNMASVDNTDAVCNRVAVDSVLDSEDDSVDVAESDGKVLEVAANGPPSSLSRRGSTPLFVVPIYVLLVSIHYMS